MENVKVNKGEFLKCNQRSHTANLIVLAIEAQYNDTDDQFQAVVLVDHGSDYETVDLITNFNKHAFDPISINVYAEI
jgi:hypothetical protein